MTTKLMLAVSALATAMLVVAPAEPQPVDEPETPSLEVEEVADDAERVEVLLGGAEARAQSFAIEG